VDVQTIYLVLVIRRIVVDIVDGLRAGRGVIRGGGRSIGKFDHLFGSGVTTVDSVSPARYSVYGVWVRRVPAVFFKRANAYRPVVHEARFTWKRLKGEEDVILENFFARINSRGQIAGGAKPRVSAAYEFGLPHLSFDKSDFRVFIDSFRITIEIRIYIARVSLIMISITIFLQVYYSKKKKI